MISFDKDFIHAKNARFMATSGNVIARLNEIMPKIISEAELGKTKLDLGKCMVDYDDLYKFGGIESSPRHQQWKKLVEMLRSYGYEVLYVDTEKVKTTIIVW